MHKLSFLSSYFEFFVGIVVYIVFIGLIYGVEPLFLSLGVKCFKAIEASEHNLFRCLYVMDYFLLLLFQFLQYVFCSFLLLQCIYQLLLIILTGNMQA